MAIVVRKEDDEEFEFNSIQFVKTDYQDERQVNKKRRSRTSVLEDLQKKKTTSCRN